MDSADNRAQMKHVNLNQHNCIPELILSMQNGKHVFKKSTVSLLMNAHKYGHRTVVTILQHHTKLQMRSHENNNARTKIKWLYHSFE